MNQRTNTLSQARRLQWTALLLILALAAYLRLARNVHTPGWYTDEGTHLDIAQNLAQGRMQYMVIQQSTLLFAKLPLFELLLAAWLRVIGGGMGALRGLTGVLGVISVGALYAAVRRVHRDAALALTAALLLAIYPQAVLYSRFGFSYNLLAPLMSLLYLGLCEYVRDGRRRWLAFAALVIGIGGLSDLWMFALAAPLLLLALARDWRDALGSVPLLLAPIGLYAAYMLVQAPGAFLFDLRFTLARLSGASLAQQVETLTLNYTILASQDQWLALALAGAFVGRPARARGVHLLLLLSPIIILGRTEALFNLSAYYVIPLFPLISLGAATLLRWGAPYALRAIRETLTALFEKQLTEKLTSLVACLLLLAIVATPFVISARHSARQTRQGFSTIVDPFLLDPRNARQAAEFVNALTYDDDGVEDSDLVLASPGLAWLLQANTADFQMSIAFTGQSTPHLPPDIPLERFAFDPRLAQARFVVVDNLWRNWAVFTVPGADEMLEQVSTWPLVFQAGEIEVYCNPARSGC